MKTILNRTRIAFATFVTVVALSACGAAAPATVPNSAPTAIALVSATTAPVSIPTALPVDAPTTAPADVSAAPTAVASTASQSASTAKLNLNEVTGDQLLSTIPNFNSRMVGEFGEYRPYTSILQFRKEIGKYVDEAQVASYEQYVYVPVDVNQADSATLQQLPGVDAAIADTLIAARPYASNQAFLDKLSSAVSPAQLTDAATYLAK